MRFVRIVRHRWRSLLRSSREEREMRDELGMHLEELTREYIAAGLSEAEAGRAARRAMQQKGRVRGMARHRPVHVVNRKVAHAFPARIASTSV